MNRLESFFYKSGCWFSTNPQHLNELSMDELRTLIDHIEIKPREFAEVLISSFPEKTFCKQKDFDYLFGNENWSTSFWFFEDAENCIKQEEGHN
jgi:hypothetical protein